MAFILADRVQETGTANTTVSFTLSGASTGFQTFAAVGNTNTTYYGATDGTNWEVGIGTYSTTGPTLTRTTILSSSNSGSAVTFSGTVTVWVDYPAGQAVYEDASNTVTGYAISGGTINNTVIGGTTPEAGTVTTFAVAGGLQNLFLQSQTFNVSGNWTNTALTINQTATTAPDSTATGNSLIPTAVSSLHRIQQTPSITAGVTYTASVYAKANGYNYLFANCNAAFNATTTFNLSTGTISTTGFGTATITDAGNGWYRCAVTGTATVTGNNTLFFQVNNTQTGTVDDTFTGNGTSGIFLWGAQLETSATVHTYQVTTTVVASSNPKISLSGGGSIGLESTGSMYLQPAGTGALQAQATTSTAVGGNARGANAVDWLTSRNAASQVASGALSVIAGGNRNTASGIVAFVGGGTDQVASGVNTFVGGGQNNTASLNFATICGGRANTAAGYYNFIGAGWTNSGTSGTAVTTQTTTIAITAGTTIYLSSANANIRVGAYISGTGISSDTSVTSTVTTGTPAVMTGSTITVTTGRLTVGTLTSGTIVAGQVLTGTGVPAGTYIVSNVSGSGSGSVWNTNITTAVASTTITGTAFTFTISQAATTAAGVTLSFFTPHGVVVGGGNNQATGSYSFIGGGGDAGTAANRNAASGDWSTIGGGFRNTVATASAYATIAGGASNAITGNGYSFIGSGFGSTVTNDYASVLGGYTNAATGRFSSILGGGWGTARGIVGNQVSPAGFASIAGVLGTSQSALLILARQTTDATATALSSDSNTASSTNQVILPNNSAYYFKGSVIAGVTGAGNSKAWSFEGAIKRGASVGTTAIVGTVVLNTIAQDAGASTWVIAITADTTNGGIRVTVTGQAATTIRWVCKIETTEMTF